MKAFILCAGLGTRLKSLTEDQPKVMVEIGGKLVLEHLILLCKKHRIKEIIVNLHHLPDKIKEYFKDGSKWGVSIEYSFEKELMGSAGGLEYAERLLGGKDFLLLNGDVMTNVDLSDMVRFHKVKGGIGTIFVHKTDHPYDSDLVEYDENFLVKKFFRPKSGDEFNPVSKTGTHIFKPKVLEYIPGGKKYSLEKQLIPDLLRKGSKLYAYYSDVYSKDIGTPERLVQVRNDWEEGKIDI